ncbi:MAG: DUF5317 family protein [Chloroflexi bacterium]|nr:DUF5317 family protein [Chloroflexota bacterium]
MVLFAAALFIILLLLLFFRRDHLAGLELPKLDLLWLPVLAFGLQLPVFLYVFDRYGLRLGMLLLSQGMLLIFVWRNRHLRFVQILALGLLLNLLPMVANGGYMPVTPEALATMHPGTVSADWPSGTQRMRGVALNESETWFWTLSDIFVLGPFYLPPAPWAIAFSIGDVILILGFTWAFFSALQSRKLPMPAFQLDPQQSQRGE